MKIFHLVRESTVGESYCKDSNGYPDLKQALVGNFSPEEGTIDGITQKVLSLAKYNKAKIYSGCDEQTQGYFILNVALIW